MIQWIVWGTWVFCVVFVGTAIGVPTERCLDERLSREEAIARNNWAYNCGYLGFRQFRSNKFLPNGQLRRHIRYPVFSSQSDAHDWVTAPVKAMQACHWPVYQNYQQIHTCNTLLPEEERQICHQTLKKAFDLAEISQDQYLQFKHENLAMLFDPPNQANGLVKCHEYLILREI